METRSLGGVLLAFCGLVLLIAGFRGTLQKIWQDATGIGATAAPANDKVIPVATDAGNVTYALPAGYPGTGNLLAGGVPASAHAG